MYSFFHSFTFGLPFCLWSKAERVSADDKLNYDYSFAPFSLMPVIITGKEAKTFGFG